MPRKTRSYREALLEALTDPVEAAHYLNAALGDSPEMFRKACLNVIQARRVAKIAREAGLTRESLYRSFSVEGNPTLETLSSVLHAVGLTLAVRTQIESIASPAEPSAPRTQAVVSVGRAGIAAAYPVIECFAGVKETGGAVDSVLRMSTLEPSDHSLYVKQQSGAGSLPESITGSVELALPTAVPFPVWRSQSDQETPMSRLLQ